ncbi:EpsG family protein [Butyrivibrio proteoclasticus]|uniref:EpsG family protein n=1 Tax=Butyrivibrio proteoclasticus TaxID=43305 RepID=A0A1I5PWE6_9FIRM|nr:EpsG family protein [Butyrivibrio proteoclasticus]SFP38219.1 EpsG family protein [Butyrivibrio proteoclasticus]
MVAAEWSNATFIFYIFIIFFCVLLTRTFGTRCFSVQVVGASRHIPIGLSCVAILLITIKGISLTGTDVKIGAGYWLDFMSADTFHGFRDYAIEPLYILLNVVVKNTFNSYCVFLMLVAVITVIPPVYLIWKYRDKANVSQAVFVYLCLFYFNSFSAIRQYMAVSISFFVFDALYEKKNIKSLLLIFAAAFMHRSVLILVIPYIYMTFNKIKKRHLIMGIVVMLVSSALLRNDVYAKFAASERYYVYKATESISFGLEQFVYYIPLFILYHYGKAKKQDNNFDRLSFAYLCMGFLFGLMGYVITIFGRMQAIMLPLIIIAPYYFRSSYKWVKDSKMLFDMALYVYCSARFYIWISQYYLGETLMPYTTIWGLSI